jgi:VWFA-related protein
MKRIILFILFALSFLAFSSPPAPGPEGRQAKFQDRLQYEVNVVRKLIHVIVTDRNGKSITDLRKDEFILFDNGREMTITEFENHTLSLPGEEGRPAAAASPIEKAPAPAAPLMNRTFLFLFDLVFADPGGLRQGRQAALSFLETTLKPADLIGVLSFSGGRSLKVHHRPDRDRAAARLAIESIGLGSLMPIAPIRGFDESQIRIVGPGGEYSLVGRGSEPTSSSSKVGRIVAGNFIWALDSLAQALRYASGRKVIVLYSNGLHPSYLGRGQFIQTGNSDLGRAYKDLCNKLSAANASVFPINTEENTYLAGQTPESQKGVSSLREIASETGGRFLGDTYAVPDHIEKIDTLTASYYVLGYPIAESWKGEYHRVRVKVTRPGCEVNAQPGYFSDKPFPNYSDLEKRIHLVDLALCEKPLSQEPVRFAMQALPWAWAPPNDIRLVAEIPVGRLGDVASPRLEAVSLVFNDLDEVVDTRRVELELTRPELREKVVFFQADLSAPPGNYRCRLVLRNMETGRAAVAAASTIVPKPDPNGVMLFPPLFLISRGPSVYLSGGAAKNQKTRQPDHDAGADVARGFPVEVEKCAPFFNEPLSGDSEISAVVRCAVPGKAAADLALTASLKNPATGEVFTIPLLKIAERAEKDGRSFLLRFSVPRIPPGAYSVEISAEAQGSRSRVIRIIHIE